MKKLFFALGLLVFSAHNTWASSPVNPDTPADDSVKMVESQDVVIVGSAKETQTLWSSPTALSLISPFKAQQRGIEDIKGLSAVVPNLFIADYGSKMTTPVYLRGVGTRSSGQGVGLYVDNIPYMDKSTFDFELMDIQRIEVLRGPQGTLYGRNAMGGIINIYTLSPFDYQGTKIQMGAANYNTYNAKVSTFQKFNEKVALSVGGYWNQTDGYLTNQYTTQEANSGWDAGARAKLELRLSDRLNMSIASTYDYTDQNAFPYGLLNSTTGEIADPSYNDRGSYLRNLSSNSVRLEYKADKFTLTSNTGYQWLSDEMWMDQDFSPASIFTMTQRQLQNSINQEITMKSTHSGNYQWSVGMFGFYNALKTLSNVTFKQDGIDNIIGANLPPFIQITDTEMPNPGDFFTPSWGLAAFHQSTFNNVLTDGLSLTLGVRLDYEKQSIDYHTQMELNAMVQAPGMPVATPYKHQVVMDSSLNQDFLRFLPKVAVTYEPHDDFMVYGSLSSGYKTGGYNNQMFSEIIQDMINPMAAPSTTPLGDVISYKPEQSWNYEVGTRARMFGDALSAELALFYMDITDMQLTQFIDGGNGRILSNAGKGQSYGVELALSSNPVGNLFLDASYGYNHSTFSEYSLGESGSGMVDYSGNSTPYVPAHTFTIGASYGFDLNGWFRNLTLSTQYKGNGKTYWDEANTVSQPFYGLLSAKVSLLTQSNVRLDLWADNITGTEYEAFYFESFGSKFLERGRPATFGVTLGINL